MILGFQHSIGYHRRKTGQFVISSSKTPFLKTDEAIPHRSINPIWQTSTQKRSGMSNASHFESTGYLPDNEIKKKLKEIKRTDLRTVDFESLKMSIMRLSKGLTVEAPKYNPGLTLYRGRSINRRPVKVRDLGPPPPHLVSDFGRVNRPKQSMFYLNSSRNAVFFELRLNAADYLVMGHWEVIEKLLMFPVGYSSSVFHQMNSNRPLPTFGPSSHPLLHNPTNLLLENFFAEQFTKDVPRENPWEFKISAAISENRLSLQEADGVIYPTIAMRANSDNFALRATRNRKLVLKKAEFIRVDVVEEFSFKVTVLDTATEFPNGKILWKGKPKWTLESGELLKFVVEDGQWRAYDINRRVREYD